jgi:hypothetical protein
LSTLAASTTAGPRDPEKPPVTAQQGRETPRYGLHPEPYATRSVLFRSL